MTEISINIKKGRALEVKEMCNYALAYMNEHNIKNKTIEKSAKDIIDKMDWLLDNPLKDGRY